MTARTVIGDYHVLERIGEGSFGRVYRGRRKYSSQVVALKFISKAGKLKKDVEKLRQEIQILQNLKHENIIRMLDYFELDKEFCVVTEFAQGELYEILDDDQKIPVREVQRIAKQLVRALFELHRNRIMHRDMKPQNILVGTDGLVKLCDFGFARAMSDGTSVLTSIKGTPLYMAPELVKEDPYNHKADLWSLGVILFELAVGQPPFYTNSIYKLVNLIVRTDVEYPPDLPPDFKSFLQCLLNKDPQQRMGWPELLHHPFVSETEQERLERDKRLRLQMFSRFKMIDEHAEKQRKSRSTAGKNSSTAPPKDKYEDPAVVFAKRFSKRNSEQTSRSRNKGICSSLQRESCSGSRYSDNQHEQESGDVNNETAVLDKSDNLRPARVPKDTQHLDGTSVQDGRKSIQTKSDGSKVTLHRGSTEHSIRANPALALSQPVADAAGGLTPSEFFHNARPSPADKTLSLSTVDAAPAGFDEADGDEVLQPSTKEQESRYRFEELVRPKIDIALSRQWTTWLKLANRSLSAALSIIKEPVHRKNVGERASDSEISEVEGKSSAAVNEFSKCLSLVLNTSFISSNACHSDRLTLSCALRTAAKVARALFLLGPTKLSVKTLLHARKTFQSLLEHIFAFAQACAEELEKDKSFAGPLEQCLDTLRAFAPFLEGRFALAFITDSHEVSEDVARAAEEDAASTAEGDDEDYDGDTETLSAGVNSHKEGAFIRYLYAGAASLVARVLSDGHGSSLSEEGSRRERRRSRKSMVCKALYFISSLATHSSIQHFGELFGALLGHEVPSLVCLFLVEAMREEEKEEKEEEGTEGDYVHGGRETRRRRSSLNRFAESEEEGGSDEAAEECLARAALRALAALTDPLGPGWLPNFRMPLAEAIATCPAAFGLADRPQKVEVTKPSGRGMIDDRASDRVIALARHGHFPSTPSASSSPPSVSSSSPSTPTLSQPSQVTNYFGSPRGPGGAGAGYARRAPGQTSRVTQLYEQRCAAHRHLRRAILQTSSAVSLQLALRQLCELSLVHLADRAREEEEEGDDEDDDDDDDDDDEEEEDPAKEEDGEEEDEEHEDRRGETKRPRKHTGARRRALDIYRQLDKHKLRPLADVMSILHNLYRSSVHLCKQLVEDSGEAHEPASRSSSERGSLSASPSSSPSSSSPLSSSKSHSSSHLAESSCVTALSSVKRDSVLAPNVMALLHIGADLSNSDDPLTQILLSRLRSHAHMIMTDILRAKVLSMPEVKHCLRTAETALTFSTSSAVGETAASLLAQSLATLSERIHKSPAACSAAQPLQDLTEREKKEAEQLLKRALADAAAPRMMNAVLNVLSAHEDEAEGAQGVVLHYSTKRIPPHLSVPVHSCAQGLRTGSAVDGAIRLLLSLLTVSEKYPSLSDNIFQSFVTQRIWLCLYEQLTSPSSSRAAVSPRSLSYAVKVLRRILQWNLELRKREQKLVSLANPASSSSSMSTCSSSCSITPHSTLSYSISSSSGSAAASSSSSSSPSPHLCSNFPDAGLVSPDLHLLRSLTVYLNAHHLRLLSAWPANVGGGKEGVSLLVDQVVRVFLTALAYDGDQKALRPAPNLPQLPQSQILSGKDLDAASLVASSSLTNRELMLQLNIVRSCLSALRGPQRADYCLSRREMLLPLSFVRLLLAEDRSGQFAQQLVDCGGISVLQRCQLMDPSDKESLQLSLSILLMASKACRGAAEQVLSSGLVRDFFALFCHPSLQLRQQLCQLLGHLCRASAKVCAALTIDLARNSAQWGNAHDDGRSSGSLPHSQGTAETNRGERETWTDKEQGVERSGKPSTLVDHLNECCASQDACLRKWACFAIGSAVCHDDSLYPHFAPALARIRACLLDGDFRVRYNAAAAVANLVNHSDYLCRHLIQMKFAESLFRLAESDKEKAVRRISLLALQNMLVYRSVRTAIGLTNEVSCESFKSMLRTMAMKEEDASVRERLEKVVEELEQPAIGPQEPHTQS